MNERKRVKRNQSREEKLLREIDSQLAVIELLNGGIGSQDVDAVVPDRVSFLQSSRLSHTGLAASDLQLDPGVGCAQEGNAVAFHFDEFGESHLLPVSVHRSGGAVFELVAQWQPNVVLLGLVVASTYFGNGDSLPQTAIHDQMGPAAIPVDSAEVFPNVAGFPSAVTPEFVFADDTEDDSQVCDVSPPRFSFCLDVENNRVDIWRSAGAKGTDESQWIIAEFECDGLGDAHCRAVRLARGNDSSTNRRLLGGFDLPLPADQCGVIYLTVREFQESDVRRLNSQEVSEFLLDHEVANIPLSMNGKGNYQFARSAADLEQWDDGEYEILVRSARVEGTRFSTPAAQYDVLCRLVDESFDRLNALSVARLRDVHRAEDARQDALTGVLGARYLPQDEADLLRYIGRAVINACSKQARPGEGRFVPSGHEETCRCADPRTEEPDEVFFQQYMFERLRSARQRLSARDQELLRLRFDDGLSWTEAGGRLGVTPQRVYQLGRSAMRRLRRELCSDEAFDYVLATRR